MITENTVYAQSFTADNTLNAVGNYRIITFDAPILGAIAFTEYEDAISGLSAGFSVGRFFRWSRNGDTYSMWSEFDPLAASELFAVQPSSDGLWIEFKFQLLSDSGDPCDTGTAVSPPVSIDSISFTLQRDTAISQPPAGRPKVACGCSNENCVSPVVLNKDFTFDPYAINSGLNLYKDLSQMVNMMFGHEVQYVRVAPRQKGRDVFLGEYTVFGDPVGKCLKVLVPNNEFPDSKPTFNQYGIDFEVPFEVHIDRVYWEENVAKNSMPQQFDVLYFPLMNRIYEVQSTYMFRDFMYQPLYYKLALVKYQDRANRDLGEFKNALDDMVIDPIALFGEEEKQETERIVKPQQYQTITEDKDPIRYSIHRQLEIARYDLYNNWVLLTQNYYNLEPLYYTHGTADAIVYKPAFSLPADSNRAYCFWFAAKTNTKDANTERNLLTGRNDANVGINIDLIVNDGSPADSVIITYNNTQEIFVLPEKLVIDKWYGLVVNLSQEFDQVSITLWTMQKGKTAELRMVYEEARAIATVAAQTDFRYRIQASPLLLTNIRIFNQMIPTETQSNILGQMVVKDANLAIAIDNAKPILRLARVIDPK